MWSRVQKEVSCNRVRPRHFLGGGGDWDGLGLTGSGDGKESR